MVIRDVKIVAGASLSETFTVRDHAIVGLLTPGTLETGTVALNVLACIHEGGAPVSAVTCSGTQIAYTVVAATSQYVSAVGQDMVSAPLVQLQAVDSSNVAKAQTGAATIRVVLRRLFN